MFLQTLILSHTFTTSCIKGCCTKTRQNRIASIVIVFTVRFVATLCVYKERYMKYFVFVYFIGIRHLSLILFIGHCEHHHKALQSQVLQYWPTWSHHVDPGLHHCSIQSHCLLITQCKNKTNQLFSAGTLQHILTILTFAFLFLLFRPPELRPRSFSALWCVFPTFMGSFQPFIQRQQMQYLPSSQM